MPSRLYYELLAPVISPLIDSAILAVTDFASSLDSCILSFGYFPDVFAINGDSVVVAMAVIQRLT